MLLYLPRERLSSSSSLRCRWSTDPCPVERVALEPADPQNFLAFVQLRCRLQVGFGSFFCLGFGVCFLFRSWCFFKVVFFGRGEEGVSVFCLLILRCSVFFWVFCFLFVDCFCCCFFGACWFFLGGGQGFWERRGGEKSG